VAIYFDHLLALVQPSALTGPVLVTLLTLMIVIVQTILYDCVGSAILTPDVGPLTYPVHGLVGLDVEARYC